MTKYIVIIFLFSFPILAQISPGDLTKSHASLEGMKNCTVCHDLGKQVSNDKCLTCHKEIGQRITLNRGYHSSSDVKGKDCWKCHSEHHGRNFEIVHFRKNVFDHNKTNFTLSGVHSNLSCEKCHKQQYIQNTELKKRANTYLGLETKCKNCHEDYHKNTLGDNCAGCHNLNKFRPANIFNHDKAKFPLTGAHKNTSCEKCHAKITDNGKVFQKFTGLSYKNCIDCHKDYHNGKLGTNCQKCHSSSSFRSVSKSQFDHSKTSYPLVGKHTDVECSKCHGLKLSSKPKHETCLSCHKDFHIGQLTRNNKIIDCIECHTEKGFTPSLFSIEKHSAAKYKLSGSHLAVPCKSCHLLKNEWKFKIVSQGCGDCHENIHRDEISPKFMGNKNCAACHDVGAWNQVTFDHNQTDFRLIGIHWKTACDKCHTKSENGVKRFIFVSLDKKCVTCHNDIHYSQFSEADKTDCGRCHNFDNWKATNFDHSKTKFPLDGAHKKVKCIKCHKQIFNSEKQLYIKYKIEDIKCAACHL
ncbi:MAG: cytochrome C [Flavobacterium sp.]|nr:cytochrome C [Flavobacterium sp.]